ncbi:hypothetical protein ASPVEDRAFT_81427 [Aspergillus versicolor CBS 583.65]|uniref:UBZ4-type domain-containing protein n=1 Tax=Aspergillus versicolor CBS 583.65 TaxID=1036611 RepID=A0A1L9PE88_ASPVE|nr:uncharacterized protein ASPVEDRAFT_81427 [Aspergillus versicolor CBS 583.65]OJI99837.1 hypothetical protein ASPVEDRAFT_81427 [Aspergillus versicolor CBS 583.65]
MPSVPTTKDVIPGASVNIILKADQRTGRTVSGAIADVLTRGNHPRGIKVRLTDGRVGRVQSMKLGTGGGDGTSDLPTPQVQPAEDWAPRRGKGRGRGRGPTEDSEAGLPSGDIGLDAYITQGRKPRQNGKGRGRGRGANHDASQQSQLGNESPPPPVEAPAVTCPVCGDFEGDEMAVAYHVGSHFAE